MVDFSWAPSLASLWVSVWRSLAPGDIGEWTEGMEMIFYDMICIYVYIYIYTYIYPHTQYMYKIISIHILLRRHT